MIHIRRLSTYPHFETEARGNSDMAYSLGPFGHSTDIRMEQSAGNSTIATNLVARLFSLSNMAAGKGENLGDYCNVKP